MNIFTVVQSLFSQIDSKARLHENSDEKLQSFHVSVRYRIDHCSTFRHNSKMRQSSVFVNAVCCYYFLAV